MGRFIVSSQDHRGPASRLGTPSSGVQAHARGWDLGGRVSMYDSGGRDRMEFTLTGGSNNAKVRDVSVVATLDDGKLEVEVLVDNKRQPLPRRRKA